MYEIKSMNIWFIFSWKYPGFANPNRQSLLPVLTPQYHYIKKITNVIHQFNMMMNHIQPKVVEYLDPYRLKTIPFI